MLKESRIIELEQTLLSMLIKQRELFNELLKRTITDDFFIDEQNHLVFTALDQLHSKRLPFDFHLILDRVLKLTTSDEFDAEDYLMILWENETDPGSFEHLLRFLDEQCLRRKAITELSEMVKQTVDDHTDLYKVFSTGTASLVRLIHPIRTGQAKQINGITKEVYKRIEGIQSNELWVNGISTGYQKIDEILSGFSSGQVYVIASRPLAGKTTFLINLLLHILLDKKTSHSALFFSPGLSAEHISQRMLSCTSGVLLEKIMIGKMEEEELLRLYRKGVAQLSEMDLTMVDNTHTTIDDIRLKLQLSQTDSYDILLIDSLHLIERLNERHNDLMKQLKLLSREFKIPVVVTSDLKPREGMPEDEIRKPTLSDLSEHSGIEQEADVIMLLHRPEYYDFNSGEIGEMYVRIAKNRTGPLDTIQLKAYMQIQRITDPNDQGNTEGNEKFKFGKIDFDEDSPF